MKEMKESFPEVAEVEGIVDILKITFENGEVRYVKSHWTEEMTDNLQFGEKGRGRRKNPLAPSRSMWIETEVTIETDRAVFINRKDRYTPEELWYRGKKSIPKL